MLRALSIGRRFLSLAVLAGAGALLHCGSSTDAPGSDSENAAVTTAAAASNRHVSFLVASDLHFGYGENGSFNALPAGEEDATEDAVDDEEADVDDDAEVEADAKHPLTMEQRNENLVEAMRETNRKGDPDLAAHHIHHDFRGLIVTGDITNDGQKDQWHEFTQLYTGFPLDVYETSGNHDYPWTRAKTGYSRGTDVFDIRHIISRNDKATREGLVDSDPDSGSYVWLWDDVLFVNLGVKASNFDGSKIEKNGERRYTDPFDSLSFLKKMLAKHAGDGKPVVLGFHYPMKAGADRMTPGERTQLHDVIARYHVIAILHGHRHRSTTYSWCGIPVLEIDSPRNAAWGRDASFVAVDIDLTSHLLNAQTVRYLETDKGLLVRYTPHAPEYNPTKDASKFWRIDDLKLGSIKVEQNCAVGEEGPSF